MDQFDIIVIGGGSAGSAAAGRLAEDGSRSVCLIEAGGRNDTIRVKTPGFMPFIPDASNYRYETVPQKGLNGRRLVLTSTQPAMSSGACRAHSVFPTRFPSCPRPEHWWTSHGLPPAMLPYWRFSTAPACAFPRLFH